MNNKPRIGITVGDFNGIGPELILKTFSNDLVFNYCTPIIYGNVFIFKYYAQLLEKNPLDFNIVRNESDIKANAINLRVCSKERIAITPGQASTEAGKFAYDALELAIQDIKDGLIENILTAPIDKKSTTDAGLGFNGHTEYFAAKFDCEVQMLLLDDELRVAMVTGHTALKQVAEKITQESIVSSLKTLHQNLKSDFGIAKPKIAVLGVNPHSGDNGLMGKEEIEKIAPAIREAQKSGLLAFGPYAPDGFFGSGNENNFDAILGMYHDQVLIPFKQKAFHSGVNYTAGLPMIRTSPDHGTAYDIAGKGLADTSSFINALYLINKVHRNRAEFYDTSNTPLKYKEHRREKFSIGVPDLN